MQMGTTLKELESCSTTPVEVKVRPTSYVGALPILNPRVTPRIYIRVEDRRWVMRKARGQCENVGQGGVRCSSRRYLHVDHKIPLALGGLNARSNYRVLCKPCNLYYAKMYLGEIMNQYVPSMN
jgi:5-methylcytosine-specific restriction endonuclease McrA